MKLNSLKVMSGRQCFWLFLIFPGFLWAQTYPAKKSLKILLPIQPYVSWYLPEKENRFRDVVKKFPKHYTVLALEIVVLGRARSAFYAAKFKKVKYAGDLTYS